MPKLGEWRIFQPKISMFELFKKSVYQTSKNKPDEKHQKVYFFKKKLFCLKSGKLVNC